MTKSRKESSQQNAQDARAAELEKEIEIAIQKAKRDENIPQTPRDFTNEAARKMQKGRDKKKEDG